jgi:hypothetical protein
MIFRDSNIMCERFTEITERVFIETKRTENGPAAIMNDKGSFVIAN